MPSKVSQKASINQQYTPDFLKGLLERMLFIRRFEEKAGQMYGLRKIGGFCHLYIGQEAVAVGSIAACDLRKDYVITTYRDHGHALMCGSDPKAVMAELYGKKTGVSKGKGGSMHLFDVKNHFYGGHGIVGGNIPIGTGMAFTIKYKKEDGVVLCYFGEGAIHMGSFHESVNMAAVWGLPIVFICENNKYGMGTDYQRISSLRSFHTIAENYKIKGVGLNGMKVLEVYEGIKSLLEEVRKGKPAICEMVTYRYKGHSMSDPAKYRTKEELEFYKTSDPIVQLYTDLQAAAIITDKDYDQLDTTIKAQVEQAVLFAEQSDQPDLGSIYEDIIK